MREIEPHVSVLLEHHLFVEDSLEHLVAVVAVDLLLVGKQKEVEGLGNLS